MKKKIKLFLDDERPCPDGWTPAKTAKEAISLLESCCVTDLSLDHDLGEEKNGNGNDVLVWVEAKVFLEEKYIPPRMRVHSANPSAFQKMQMGIDRINTEYYHRIRNRKKKV